MPELKRIWNDNYQVYGRRKLWRQAVREGFEVGRDRVARLMAELGNRRGGAGQDRPHHDSRRQGGTAGGSGRPQLERRSAQPAVGDPRGGLHGWQRW
ncbi:MAG TPA: IS3 family transposase [Acidimicrobiia bacterium]|nr:IS3 family transposase [Acidimicrobiia bacterium]